MGKQKSCEMCKNSVLDNSLGEKKKRILCDDCFSKIKQSIIYWYSEKKFGREAISKKILELFEEEMELGFHCANMRVLNSIKKLAKSPEFLEFVRENYGIK